MIIRIISIIIHILTLLILYLLSLIDRPLSLLTQHFFEKFIRQKLFKLIFLIPNHILETL
jgi:hypothetical protein